MAAAHRKRRWVLAECSLQCRQPCAFVCANCKQIWEIVEALAAKLKRMWGQPATAGARIVYSTISQGWWRCLSKGCARYPPEVALVIHKLTSPASSSVNSKVLLSRRAMHFKISLFISHLFYLSVSLTSSGSCDQVCWHRFVGNDFPAVSASENDVSSKSCSLFSWNNQKLYETLSWM